MILTRNSELQKTIDLEVRGSGCSLTKGEESKIPTCLTSLKYHKNRMWVDSPPIPVILCNSPHLSREQEKIMSLRSEKEVPFPCLTGLLQEHKK